MKADEKSRLREDAVKHIPVKRAEGDHQAAEEDIHQSDGAIDNMQDYVAGYYHLLEDAADLLRAREGDVEEAPRHSISQKT